MEIPPHSYGVSLAVWDHTVLPATRHKRTHPASTPARQAGTRFTDHLRMAGWVSPGPGCKEQLAHGCYLVVKRLGIEPAPVERKSNAVTITPPSHGTGRESPGRKWRRQLKADQNGVEVWPTASTWMRVESRSRSHAYENWRHTHNLYQKRDNYS